MNQATLLHLVSLTLVICTAVLGVPALIRDRSPRIRPTPPLNITPTPLWVVVAPSQRWFLNGDPLPRVQLAAELRRQPEAAVHLLPAAGLSVADVGDALRWLRGLGRRAVQLEMTPPR